MIEKGVKIGQYAVGVVDGRLPREMRTLGCLLPCHCVWSPGLFLLISIEFFKSIFLVICFHVWHVNFVCRWVGGFWSSGVLCFPNFEYYRFQEVRMFVAVNLKINRTVKKAGDVIMTVRIIAYYQLMQVCQVKTLRSAVSVIYNIELIISFFSRLCSWSYAFIWHDCRGKKKRRIKNLLFYREVFHLFEM